MDNPVKPLSVVLEETRSKLTGSFNQIISDSKLPAYLVEGLVVELLADIRKQKNVELVRDTITAIKSQTDTKCKIDSKTKERN